MTARFVLMALLAGVLLYAWMQYRKAPAISFVAMLIGIVGLYFVAIPEHATRLAEWAGIGRGVDLVFYVWNALSLIILLNLHLKLRAQTEIITALARAVAMAQAAAPAEVDSANRDGAAP
jgi:hypothetical protein